MNPGKQSCINLILTSKRHIFQNSSGIETHLSDFHRMILTATKITFQKFRPRLINYSDYKYFGNENYRKYLLSKISNSGLSFDDSGFSEFFYLCRVTLDQHALLKQNYTRGESYVMHTQNFLERNCEKS